MLTLPSHDMLLQRVTTRLSYTGQLISSDGYFWEVKLSQEQYKINALCRVPVALAMQRVPGTRAVLRGYRLNSGGGLECPELPFHLSGSLAAAETLIDRGHVRVEVRERSVELHLLCGQLFNQSCMTLHPLAMPLLQPLNHPHPPLHKLRLYIGSSGQIAAFLERGNCPLHPVGIVRKIPQAEVQVGLIDRHRLFH